ncbi:hypothetical protein [Cellulomonas sp. HZM]|uniref:hypothetical protein n=1 Tax=Cellulomonas sp. HZM TaxID=1454010 RepID=UPI00049324E6|nr:hypothetical protein [Cellulomonas sp. HZM]
MPVTTKSRAAAAACAVALCAGCVGPAGADRHSDEVLGTALDGAASALAIGTLTVDLLADGRTFRTVADTTLQDAIEDASSAQGTLARDQPATPQMSKARAAGVEAVASAVTALADAREWVNGVDGTDVADVRSALGVATQRVDDASDAVDAAAGSGS